MIDEKPPVWGERLIKMAEEPLSKAGRHRAPSPFRQNNLPVLVSVDAWDDFEDVHLDVDHLTRRRILNGDQSQPAQAAFDVLRTKLLQTLKDRRWNRVAITSPTKGCGKTFVAANLALSLARRSGSRTVLLDMDLRSPSLADTLGISYPGTMRHFLSGKLRADEYLLRVSENLVVGLNDEIETEAADLLQNESTRETLEIMRHELEPDVILYDLPPALQNDDVLSFLPQVDGVLMVIGGGQTKAADVRKVEKLLGDQAPLLGVILNRDEGISGGLF